MIDRIAVGIPDKRCLEREGVRVPRRRGQQIVATDLSWWEFVESHTTDDLELLTSLFRQVTSRKFELRARAHHHSISTIPTWMQFDLFVGFLVKEPIIPYIWIGWH